MTSMIRTIKGILLGAMLVVSTITVFFTDGTPYWNDIAFCVWALCILTVADYFDKD